MDILLQKVFADVDQQRINLDNFNKEMLDNLDKNNRGFWEGMDHTNKDVINEMQRLMDELQEAPKPIVSFLQNAVSKPFNPFSS
jgi:GH25 family lysozyme M1 (1,4-beta-N-acetylmuramidase)